jgi:hypothetical protein
MQSNEPKRSGRQSGIQSPARQTSNLKASAIPSKSGIKSPARQTSNLKAAAVSETKSPARQDSNLKAAAISETKSSARQDSNLKASAIPSKLPARQTSNLRASALPKASVSSTPQATPNQPKSTHLPTPQPHQTPKASDTIHRQQSTEAQSPAYKPKESFFIGDPNVDNSNQTVKALQDEITDLNNKLDSLRYFFHRFVHHHFTL